MSVQSQIALRHSIWSDLGLCGTNRLGLIDVHIHLGLNEFCVDETKRFKYDLEKL